MLKSLLSFVSNLFAYINANRLIKLGKLEQREANRKEFEKKKAIVDAIRNSNTSTDGDGSNKWLYPPNRDDK